MTNCRFEENSKGGLANIKSSPLITNCVFIGNTTSSDGGGMRIIGGSTTVTNSNFSSNVAGDDSGGIYIISGIVTVTNCIFRDNTAVFGGGMYNETSSPGVTSCRFLGNGPCADGGGMYNINSARPSVVNCDFSGNTVTSTGGGMSNGGTSNPGVISSTFRGNTANQGGGMFNSFSSPTLIHCILWGNSDTDGMISSSQMHTTTGSPAVSYSDLQGGVVIGTGNISANPGFTDANGADNVFGTLDDDLRLLDGPFCIDTGSNSVVPVSVSTDLGGEDRFVDDVLTDDTGTGGPPTVDMGAYEYVPVVMFGAMFKRADGNLDGVTDIADAVELLRILFLHTPTRHNCASAYDYNSDFEIDFIDTIFLLFYLFDGQRAPAEPFHDCGFEALDQGLGCRSYAPCEG